MPARNAPSAIDRPSRSVNAAMPSVTSSRFSMNSSCERRAATRWNQRDSSFCPRNRIKTSATVIFTAAMESVSTRSVGFLPSDGTTISSSTTARSWNSSTLMMLRPCSVSSCRRSASIFETMAVDDIANAPPSAKPACHDSGYQCDSSMVIGTVSSMVSATCDAPSPNTCRRIERSLERLNSRPIENIRNTTPNSAR